MEITSAIALHLLFDFGHFPQLTKSFRQFLLENIQFETKRRNGGRWSQSERIEKG
jgi:hypothetical protein